MYSVDRRKQLDYTVACLQKMDLYDSCQKTLVTDGKTDYIPFGWDVVQVPRINNEFCWSYMWEAGIETARYETILYLDSDRLLPRNYLTLLNVQDMEFVFTSRHFQVLKEVSLEKCQEFLTRGSEIGAFIDDDFIGMFIYEPRYRTPIHGPGKNVMSGNTAFTKTTYRLLGGVDPWYRGHGAYADTDFHFLAASKGCRFTDLEVTELHLPHDKLENGTALDTMSLHRKGLDNLIHYCCKWGLPMTFAENVAVECKIANPSLYIDEKIAESQK